MQTQALSTQGLKALLQRVISNTPAEVPQDSHHALNVFHQELPVQEDIADDVLTVSEEVAVAVIEEIAPEIPPAPQVVIHYEEPAIQVPVIQEAVIQIEKAEEQNIPPENPKQIAKLRAKIEDKEEQIAQLKKSVKELTAQEKATEKASEKIKAQLEKELEKTKQEKTHLESQKAEEIHSLTQALQEARLAATAHQDTLLSKLQTTSLDSQEAKTRLLRLLQDKKELEDKITTLSCEKATLAAKLQSLQQRATQHEESENELRNQLSAATNTLEQITQDLANTEEALQEEKELVDTLQNTIDELTDTCKELEIALSTQITETDEAKKQVLELTEQVEQVKTSQAQELAVTKACLQEQSQLFQAQTALYEEEQRKSKLLTCEHEFLQKNKEEQENHLRLLEQHLARRVKECALLSKQLDDLLDRNTELLANFAQEKERASQHELSLESLRKVENALRIELDSQANQLQDELSKKDKELITLTRKVDEKETELINLRRIQNQFFELEELVKRQAQIFSQSLVPLHKIEEQVSHHTPFAKLIPVEEKQEPTLASQTDFFAFSQNIKPQPKSLFE